MKITLEKDAIVVLIGAMATGKTTFVYHHFNSWKIISSDHIAQELMNLDTGTDPETASVNAVLKATIEARGREGLPTIVDSVGTQPVLEYARQTAYEYNRPLYAFIFPHLTDEEITQQRFQHRWNRFQHYYKQVDAINNTDLPDEFTPIVIPKRGRNHIEIEWIEPNAAFIVNPNYNYYIVPDLHGEWRVLDYYRKQLQDNERIIQLGDLVDRGESSFETFVLTKKMKDKGQLLHIKSNHDYKLSRYFRKWLQDKNKEKYHPKELITYDMKVGHGLEKTLQEFFTLPAKTMEWYAEQFIQMYTDAPEYLVLYKNEEIHFFSHAGITASLMMGNKPTNKDFPQCIFQPVVDTEGLEALIEQTNITKTVWLHVGHRYEYDDVTVHQGNNCFLVNHDIGLGKRTIETIPELMYL